MPSALTLRRTALIGLLALCTAASAQQATAWPNRPITWLVGYPAGGSVDVTTRLVARKLEEKLGQPVVVDNRPGATGGLALAAAAKAAPDGSTLITVPGPVVLATPVPAIGKELTGIATLAKGPMVLVAPVASAQPTLKDLIADMKKRPDAYSYASSGNGTSQHLAGELFNQQAQTHMLHVPYKGGGQAVTDVVGGQIPLAMLGVPPVLAHIKSGRLKAYAVTTAQRSPALPEVPTMREAGLPDFEASQWFVVAAPAGVPAERVARLNAALAEILAQPEIGAGFAAAGMAPAIASAQETSRFAAEEQRRWKDLAQKAQLTLD